MTNPLAKTVSALCAALMLGFAMFFAVSDAYAGIGVPKKRFALVVTNEYYPDIGNLQFCHSDGQTTSAVLRDLDFEVEWLKDGTIEAVRRALSELKQKAEAAGPESVVFFYFSGHAADDGTRNYLILNERVPQRPVERGTPPKELSLLEWKQANLPVIGLPYGEVTSGLATLKTKARFVVIDSHLDRDEPALFEPGQVLATQGQPLLDAADSNNYSAALASALLTPRLTVDELFKRVQLGVAQVTNGRQVPFSVNKIDKAFVLNEQAPPTDAPAARPEDSVLDEPIWISVNSSNDIQLLKVYLLRFPNGKHAAEAQKQIEESERVAAIAAKAPHPKADARLGRRVALVIGNGAYQNVNFLSNPTKDARALASALKDLGFETVQEGYDLGRDAMLKALKSFGETAAGADWAVIYYAGHGMEVKGDNYLIPVDAKLADEEDIAEEAVPMTRLVDRLKDVNGIRVLFLDACRDNPFASRMFRRGLSRGAVSRGLAEVKADSGTLIAYATKPGDTALDGEGEHSPYVTALIENVGQPGLDIRIMLSSVSDSVKAATKQRQQPWYAVDLPGKPLYLKPE